MSTDVQMHMLQEALWRPRESVEEDVYGIVDFIIELIRD